MAFRISSVILDNFKSKTKKSGVFGILRFRNLYIFLNFDQLEYEKNIAKIISSYKESNNNIVFERLSLDSFIYFIPQVSEEEAFTLLRSLESTKDKDFNLLQTTVSVVKHDSSDNLLKTAIKAQIAIDECLKNSLTILSYKGYEKKYLEQCLSVYNELKAAFESNRVTTAFQPIKDTSGKIVFYESLFRVLSETGELLAPKEFIHVAEKLLLIEHIDYFSLQHAITKLEGKKDITISVNISTLTLRNLVWRDKVFNLMKGKEIKNRIILEITETYPITFDDLIEFIQFAHGLGFRIAIDDFGSGYTSIHQLSALKVDMIKLDGKFIKSVIETHPNFLRELIILVKSRNIKVVGEYIETKKEHEVLSKMDIDYLQGYYIGKAVLDPWK